MLMSEKRREMLKYIVKTRDAHHIDCQKNGPGFVYIFASKFIDLTASSLVLFF